MVTIRGGSDIHDTPALRSDYMGALLRYLPLVYIPSFTGYHRGPMRSDTRHGLPFRASQSSSDPFPQIETVSNSL